MGRKKARFQWDSAEEETDGETIPSRRQLKDQDNEYKKVVKQLLALPHDQLRDLPLSDAVRDALMEARQLKTRKNVKGGLRRQIQRVGTLLRYDDLEAVQTALKRL